MLLLAQSLLAALKFCARMLVLLFNLVLVLVAWWRGAPKYITKRGKDFVRAFSIEQWEWRADSKELAEATSIRFQLTEPATSDSLLIDVVSHPTFNEARVVLCLGDSTFDSGQLIARQGTDPRSISCGPLLLEMRSPFRKWRLVFRGNLFDEFEQEQFVAFAGWFKPTSDARLFYSNARPSSFAPQFADRPLAFAHNFAHFFSTRSRDDYWQWGEYHFELSLNEDRFERRFRGSKETRVAFKNGREDQFSAYFENGERFAVRSECQQSHKYSFTHGFLTKIDRTVRQLGLKNEPVIFTPNNFEQMAFQTDTKEDRLIGKLKVLDAINYVRRDGTSVSIQRVKCEHNGSIGIGIFTASIQPLRNTELNVDVETIPDYKVSQREANLLIVPLTHRASLDPTLAGGKGSNLARLTALQDSQFKVPAGFVVTTAAYRQHLGRNAGLRRLVERVGQLKTQSAVGDVAQQLHDEFMSSQISAELRAQLAEVASAFGHDEHLAVRSSALGEDGADLSSAGQLDSILNVRSEGVETALKKCWASNFRKEVMTYRSTYGQPLNPPMAVVIQRMVNDAVAGVMFTADPVRRDPTRTVINALFGDGEDIVSGSKTPETIIIHKKTRQVERDKSSCVSLADVLRIGDVGLFLERLFGRPQDVEFVFKQGTIFLVQSRDITVLHRESDFELATEFDSGLLTDKEVLSLANVGEVFPNAMPPLCTTLGLTLYDKALAYMMQMSSAPRISVHSAASVNMVNNRVFFNIGELFLREWENLEDDPLTEYVVAGERILSKEMFEMGKTRFARRHRLYPLVRLGYMLHAILWGSSNALAVIEKLARQLENMRSTGTKDEIVQHIDKQCMALTELIYNHSYESSCSSFTYLIVAMIIRRSDKGELTAEMLSDIATLFGHSSAAVISADVPKALRRIALAAARSLHRRSFEQHSGEFALRVLRGDPRVAPLIDDFFARHGHRGPSELDCYGTEWSSAPDLLTHTIKTMMNDPNLAEEHEAEAFDADKTIALLKNQPKGIAKALMKFMVKQTHIGVAYREHAKNLLVKGTVALRANVKCLAAKLVAEGYLPDADLIFFLELSELRELMETRSPRLVSRALRRRHFFPKQAQHRYKYVHWGPVKPEPVENKAKLRALVQLTGTPVFEGRIVAKARVAIDLEAAKDTEPGEVLITRFTDVCWSPFFPLISGIVTEIGGLLSHGAVVAREYGLPSLIAVTSATDVFETGDLVELDSFKGTITKVVLQN